MEDILESVSGLFSKDQTLAACRHARNRQYLCVYSLCDPLCVYIEGDKSEQSMDACLTLPEVDKSSPCSSLPGLCWQPCGKLPSHPQSHYIILSSCLYSHFSFNDLCRIICSDISYLYCQNVDRQRKCS